METIESSTSIGLQAVFCQLGFLWYLSLQIKMQNGIKVISNVQYVIYVKEAGISEK